LPDSDGSVDSTSLLEESSDSSSRSLGSAKDDIDILGSLNSGVLGVDEGETVGEVESLALGLERESIRQYYIECENERMKNER